MGHIAKNVPLSHRQKDTSPKKIWVVTSPKNNFPHTSTCHIAKKVGLSHCQKKNFSSAITQVKEGFKRNKKLWKLSICEKEGSKRPTWTKGCVKRLGFQNLYPSLFHSHRCSSRGSDYKDPPQPSDPIVVTYELYLLDPPLVLKIGDQREQLCPQPLV